MKAQPFRIPEENGSYYDIIEYLGPKTFVYNTDKHCAILVQEGEIEISGNIDYLPPNMECIDSVSHEEQWKITRRIPKTKLKPQDIVQVSLDGMSVFCFPFTITVYNKTQACPSRPFRVPLNTPITI